MSATAQAVIRNKPVIVPKKRPARAHTFRWDPDTLERIERISDRQGQSINQAGEMLMREALARCELELGLVEPENAEGPKRKQK